MIPGSEIKFYLDRYITGANEAVNLGDPVTTGKEGQVIDQMQKDSEHLFASVEALDEMVMEFLEPTDFEPGDGGDIEGTISQAEEVICHVLDLVASISKLTVYPLNYPPRIKKLMEARNGR